ncbi:hypothetical protein CHS0354_012395 [Potamilus streckersoni]|uniref:Uncharacterized protein n=1 Tax=Potamilus streckersoni TaxID=2493646 RepID=A0AAE0VL96_9BIVA|nr:hypothetical protein CHS0354_012395 [Potamilus streckersoni]
MSSTLTRYILPTTKTKANVTRPLKPTINMKTNAVGSITSSANMKTYAAGSITSTTNMKNNAAGSITSTTNMKNNAAGSITSTTNMKNNAAGSITSTANMKTNATGSITSTTKLPFTVKTSTITTIKIYTAVTSSKVPNTRRASTATQSTAKVATTVPNIELLTTNPIEEKTKKDEYSMLIVVLPTGSLILVSIALITALLHCRRRNRQKQSTPMESMQQPITEDRDQYLLNENQTYGDCMETTLDQHIAKCQGHISNEYDHLQENNVRPYGTGNFYDQANFNTEDCKHLQGTVYYNLSATVQE